MKLLILKDTKIDPKQLASVMADLADFYKANAGIAVTYVTEERDYTTYPVTPDADGDGKLPESYIRAATSEIYQRYSGEGTDHVVFLIHRDNWKLNGVWGTNYSNRFNGYQVQVCRFDNQNLANSFGTLYHEVMHSHDALIKIMTGEDVNELFAHLWCYQDWDNTIVHGNRFKGCATHYTYIRHKENADALQMIAPMLRKAYQKRHEIYEQKRRTMLQTILTLSQRALVLAREVLKAKVKYK